MRGEHSDGAVPRKILKAPIASLSSDQDRITAVTPSME
jgi:hypothetical protein